MDSIGKTRVVVSIKDVIEFKVFIEILYLLLLLNVASNSAYFIIGTYFFFLHILQMFCKQIRAITYN